MCVWVRASIKLSARAVQKNERGNGRDIFSNQSAALTSDGRINHLNKNVHTYNYFHYGRYNYSNIYSVTARLVALTKQPGTFQKVAKIESPGNCASRSQQWGVSLTRTIGGKSRHRKLRWRKQFFEEKIKIAAVELISCLKNHRQQRLHLAFSSFEDRTKPDNAETAGFEPRSWSIQPH